MADGADVVYLYGFVPADAPAPPATLVGLEDRPVSTSVLDDCRAVISHLPAATYEPALLDARLRDLTWVAQRGLSHERVVAWFVDHAHIIPAPLFTLYSGMDALRAAAAARMDEVTAQLHRFRGLREWDFKAAYDAAVLTVHAAELSDEVRAFDGQIAAAPPGRRYLLEKKRAGVVSAVLEEMARRQADTVFEALAAGARDVRTLPLPRTDQALPVVLHAALLLPESGESGAAALVRQRAEELRSLGISIDWSGPWAPYRFLGPRDD